MKPIKLPFGLNRSGVLAHISEVEKGKKCGCICPACKSPLIARKSDCLRFWGYFVIGLRILTELYMKNGILLPDSMMLLALKKSGP
jgi:hypothetical protein